MAAQQQNHIQFSETQRFSEQPVIWIALGGFAFLVWYLMQQDLVFGLVYKLGLITAFAGVVMAFLITLKTEVDESAIRIRMIPFHRSWKIFSFDDISHLELIKYNPITDYGGWGIRMSFKETAYSVKGRNGLRLTLRNGRKYMIGTQKPGELAAALDRLSVEYKIAL